jgi:biopolymer transport protein ExbB
MQTHSGSAWALIGSNTDMGTSAVAIVLLAMSVATWSIIISKAIALRQQQHFAKRVEGFWQAQDMARGLEHLGATPHNPFYALALEGHEATQHLHARRKPGGDQLQDGFDVSDWVERALMKTMDDHAARAHSGLAVLASVASTAPFVGLLGTVWGIYHALVAIGAAAQVGMEQVAGPVGEALIMTALGLLVAIPAVLGYNALLRGNKALTHQLKRFAHDLHAYFVTGARVGRAEQSHEPT